MTGLTAFGVGVAFGFIASVLVAAILTAPRRLPARRTLRRRGGRAAVYLCSAHMWATVGDPNGPVHLRDAAVCWSIQSDRDGRTWTPQAVAETARHGP